MYSPPSELAAWLRSLPAPTERSDALLERTEMFERIVRSLEGSSRAQVAELGHSIGGEPIWSIALDPDGEAKQTVMVIAGLHAMEHIGCLTAVRLIEQAVRDSTRWPSTRLVVVPLVNVDGFLDVCADRAAARRRFRRANRAGVDLNRNFSRHRRASPGPGARLFAARWFTAGAGPLSEPETAAIDRLVRFEKPTAAVSLHAFGRWIFLPWAGSLARPPRWREHKEAAAAMVQAQPPGSRYRAVALGRLPFRARGAEIDHFLAAGALSFLIEIGRGPRLGRPREWLDPYRWYTPERSAAEAEVAAVLPAIEALGSFLSR